MCLSLTSAVCLSARNILCQKKDYSLGTTTYTFICWNYLVLFRRQWFNRPVSSRPGDAKYPFNVLEEQYKLYRFKADPHSTIPHVWLQHLNKQKAINWVQKQTSLGGIPWTSTLEEYKQPCCFRAPYTLDVKQSSVVYTQYSP